MGDATRAWNRVTYPLRVRLDAHAPVGPVREQLVLVTNDPRSRGIPVLVEGRVLSGVTVSPEQLFLGVVAPGTKVTRHVVVRGKRPFRVTSVTCDGSHLEVGPAPGEAAKPLHVIPVTFVAREEEGRVVERLRIRTDLDEASSELSAFAVVRP